MVRSKKISFLLSLILVFSVFTSMVASAAEVSENGSEVGDSSVVVDSPGDLDNEESGADNGGESTSEVGNGDNSGGSEGSEVGSNAGNVIYTSPAPTLDGATVNVSDESVQSIAQAVSENTDMTLTTKDGISYIVPSSVAEVWGDYQYIIVILDSSTPKYFLTNDEPLFYQLSNSPGIKILGSGVYCVNNIDLNVNNNVRTFYSSDIIWSNYTLRDNKGEVVYLSDVSDPVYYDISFDTGFDDLTYESTSSKDFVAPVLSYDGYKFDGWYLDEGFTKPYTSDYVFISNTTLYAKWIPYRIINFVTGIDGFVLDSVKVLSGEGYTAPSFSYSGYEFIGAYTDDLFEHQFVGGTVVNDNLTLYLKFEPVVYDMGALLTQQVELTKGLQVIQSQLWVVLVVGLLYYVYRFFRLFF